MLSVIANGLLNYYRKKSVEKSKNCSFSRKSHIDFLSCDFEGYNSVADEVSLYACNVGYASYIGGGSVLSMTKIGRFCSIGPNVKIYSGRHPVDTFVSTHPAFYSKRKQAGFTFADKNLFQEIKYCDEEKRYLVEIGNDVWIGANVTILEGVRIADGSIIAAGAVVTKDTKPYSVVGGVPAKIIKYRFENYEIEKLLDIKWWNKGINWISDNAMLFCNIEDFIRNV